MKTKPKKTIRMTQEQKNAELEAIRILNQALNLLEHEENVKEAETLRAYVMQRLLPAHKMYIVGQHPRSLLKQVDRRIEQAHIRLMLNKEEEKVEQEVPVPPSTILRNQRYHEMSRRMNQQNYLSIGLFILLTLSFFFFLFYMHQYSSHEFSNAFQWITQ